MADIQAEGIEADRCSKVEEELDQEEADNIHHPAAAAAAAAEGTEPGSSWIDEGVDPGMRKV